MIGVGIIQFFLFFVRIFLSLIRPLCKILIWTGLWLTVVLFLIYGIWVEPHYSEALVGTALGQTVQNFILITGVLFAVISSAQKIIRKVKSGRTNVQSSEGTDGQAVGVDKAQSAAGKEPDKIVNVKEEDLKR